MNKFFLLFLLPFFGCGNSDEGYTHYPSRQTFNQSQPASRNEQILDSLSRNDQMSMLSGLIGHCTNPKGAPTQDSVTWHQRYGNLTDGESDIVGTRMAEMGDMAITAGGKMLLGDSTNGKKGEDALVDAVVKNRTANQGCEWLEFYDDHTGFWNSCMMDKGNPTALDNVDVNSGEHEGSGVRFDWYLDGKTIRIRFEDCMKFPLTVSDPKNPKSKTNYTVRVKYWDLQMLKKGKTNDGLESWTLKDYLPEYKFTSPVKYVYSHSSTSLTKKVDKYKSAITD